MYCYYKCSIRRSIMIVRNLDDIVVSKRNVDWGTGNSRRFLIILTFGA
jgi:hypothetical protein